MLFLFFSTSLWAMRCPELIIKLQDPELIKIQQELTRLNEQYRYLDKLWDDLDTQARFQEKIEITKEMEGVSVRINELEAKIESFYNNLSERLRVSKKIDALDKEWDRLDNLGNQQTRQEEISNQIEVLEELYKDLQ